MNLNCNFEGGRGSLSQKNVCVCVCVGGGGGGGEEVGSVDIFWNKTMQFYLA